MKFKLDKKYLYWGITAFCVVLCSLLVYWGIDKWGSLLGNIKLIIVILSPFLYGFLIAYLLDSIMMLAEQKLFLPLGRKLFRDKPLRVRKFARICAILLTQLVTWSVVGGIIALIAPQIYLSIESLVVQVPDYAKEAIQWVENLLQDNPEVEMTVVNLIGNVSDALTNWINTSILPNINEFVSGLTAGVISIVKGVIYLLIGIVISIYVMYNKEKFSAQAKKLLYGCFKTETANTILREAAFVNKAFGGFITGKLIDSLIIGIIAYIVLNILRMPYVSLISLIIGVTNVIPVFGPFIGAIPCAVIVLMESPLQCLIFVVFVIVLQQFDGNVLGPKVLGNAIGLSGFWIMFAILFFGGLFGFAGMFLGVPMMAVIYNAVRRLNEKRLKKRGLPEETDVYIDVAYVDPGTKAAVYKSAEDAAATGDEDCVPAAETAETEEKKGEER